MLRRITSQVSPRLDRGTTVVLWHGPIQPERLAKFDESLRAQGGIYLLVGRLPGQRRPRIQYCGMTEQLFSRRITLDHHAGQFVRGLEIWAGTVIKPVCYNRETLLRIEHLIIHHLQPDLNKKGRVLAPPAAALACDWYGVDLVARQSVRNMLPDRLSFDGSRFENVTLTEAERVTLHQYLVG